MTDPKTKAQPQPQAQTKPQSDTGKKYTYLYVPLADKEEAKKLGGRWDPDARAWYIPPGVAPTAFERWLYAPPIVERPLYLDLHLTGRDDEHLQYMASLPTPMEVVLMDYECWRCLQCAPAFYGLADHGGLLSIDVLYWPEVIEEIGAFRKRIKLIPFGTVKPRFSKTLGKTFVSQGCPRCDAMFGNYFLSPAALHHSINLPESYPHRFPLEQWPPPSLCDYLNQAKH